VSALNGEENQGVWSATSCRPCRETGRLISTLGGVSHQVVCPWCHGTGEKIPGINAQDAPAEDGLSGQPAKDGVSGQPADSASTAEPPPAQGAADAPEGHP
jgi:hypothetical protein